ncbi:hypothetical protein HK097_008271 [Rhizophlyctis rosea]|uniref:Uncharacterized protein n=1 Tax=Rhizophlyctis rosea TaxID=64517 RepID=A0AAD5SDP6_9FUNG|nr:hypothetical protein HK097_008271 [Rhizophlyctis rosea]
MPTTTKFTPSRVPPKASAPHTPQRVDYLSIALSTLSDWALLPFLNGFFMGSANLIAKRLWSSRKEKTRLLKSRVDQAKLNVESAGVELKHKAEGAAKGLRGWGIPLGA